MQDWLNCIIPPLMQAHEIKQQLESLATKLDQMRGYL